MNWQATEQDIEKAYRELLPEDSRGCEATNPVAFHRYFNDIGFSYWQVPFIGLIEFEDDGHVEWRYICDRANLNQIFRPQLPPRVEWQVSGHHFGGRFVRIIEVIEHSSQEHHFLEKPTLVNPYLS
jgi:hypothetical protein